MRCDVVCCGARGVCGVVTYDVVGWSGMERSVTGCDNMSHF